MTPGGCNGGGSAAYDDDNDNSGSGGGATDVRLSKDDITSRIMVAAGGSGSAYGSFGAPGGDIIGYWMSCYGNIDCATPSLTNQTHGNALGKGADGHVHEKTPDSGGGGGFYGGNVGNSALSDERGYKSVSSSGSSYVSGYPLCDSVDANGKNTGKPVHYSGFNFTNPQIFNGSSTFPSPYSDSEKGHSGDGAIRITAISFNFICPVISCDIEYQGFKYYNSIIFEVFLASYPS